MQQAKQAIVHLTMGRTYSGREIFKPGANEENWARRAASDVTARIFGQIYGETGRDGMLMLTVVDALRRNLSNPKHFNEDDAPGIWDIDGTQMLPDPQWTYADLIAWGESGDDGFAGFLQACDLAPDIAYEMVIGCAGLLLVDEAIGAFDQGKPWFGFWAIYQASELAAEVWETLDQRRAKEGRRQQAATAGKAAHKDTNAFKKEVIQEWAAGRFKSIAACARWACRQFPIEADETPKRWIRSYEKGLLS
jgi:hypothetical protein